MSAVIRVVRAYACGRIIGRVKVPEALGNESSAAEAERRRALRERILSSVTGLKTQLRMLDKMGMGFVVVSIEHWIVDINDTACRMMGVDRAEIIGASVERFQRPDAEYWAEQREARHRGEAEAYTASVHRADGTTFRIRVVPEVVRDARGEVIGSTGTFTEVGEDDKLLGRTTDERIGNLESLEED